MRIFLCGNTGTSNRGCEAIVRSTVKVLNRRNGDVYLATFAPDKDAFMVKELGINIIKYGFYPTRIHRYLCVGTRKIFKKSLAGYGFIEKPLFKRLKSDDMCLNIGGDTYCYNRPAVSIALNKYTHKNGISNILWCCSVEKRSINKEIKSDLMRYEYIFAREKLTYDNLTEAGIPSDKIVKVCDPAFFLDTKEVALPKGFAEGNTVGVNVSEMVVNRDNPTVYANIINTVNYILNNTDMNVCLIPHVYNIKNNSNDYAILSKIYNEICSPRVSIVDREYDCEQLKFIISKCRFFIGARTHSTIAAYSSYVPTLVIGYSVKSKGIATDIFGTYNGYVVSYDEMQEDDRLKNAFIKIIKEEQAIKERLKSFLPIYKQSLSVAVEKYINFKDKGVRQAGRFEICDNIQCTGCMACVNACPQKCIETVISSDGFARPEIHFDKCVHCNKCVNICPVRNKFKDDGKPLNVYYATNKDAETLRRSSSGGVFTAIAESVINKGGVVFGAAFDEEFNVHHTFTETKDGIAQFNGSKYVQSTIDDCYIKVREFLEKGRTVLFSGTPCQIGGLYACLGQNYDNLFTVDVVCHGVPSPLVWREYLEFLKSKYNSGIKNIVFRDKVTGWQKYSITVEFVNGLKYSEPITRDMFLRGFVSDIYNRKSCSECSFKQYHKQSDLTLGDFWGIEKAGFENDDKGMSIIIVNSEKGNYLLSGIKDKLLINEISLDMAVTNNASFYKSCSHNGLSDAFMRTLGKKGFAKAYKKYCSDSVLSRLRRFLKKTR